jgi:SAM-dependent methyltransferase
MNVPILTYHSWLANGQGYASDNHIALASDLETIARLGLEIVSLEQIVDALLCKRLYELENRVGLSFDDGFHLDVEDTVRPSGSLCPGFLNILRESGKGSFTHATSFVIGSGELEPAPGSEDPGNPVRPVTDLWIKAERSGLIKIENHGWHHHKQPPGDMDAAMRQISRSSNFIDSVLGNGYCRLFAYPFGRPNAFLSNEFFPQQHAMHRVKAAFLTNPKPVSQGDNRWLLPRYVCVRDWRSPEELEILLREGRSRPLARRAVRRPDPTPKSPKPATKDSSYKDAWDFRARNSHSAIAAVDGSASEDILRLTGNYTATQVQVALNLRDTDSVIELGCGVGRIGRELVPFCAKWLGTDISSKMLEVARRRLQHLDSAGFLHLQRTALAGVSNNSFDKAYSVAVFCHMDKEDMFLYLQELARTLKPGGWFYFETWNLAHPVGWKRWGYEVRHWARSSQATRKEVSRNQFSVPEEVQLMTRQAGFEIGACYSDSAWVQMVAIKPDSKKSVDDARKYLKSHSREIAYDEKFTSCFSRQLDLVYGAARPEDLLTWLNSQNDTAAIEMYRQYLLALWAKNQGKWGAPPAHVYEDTRV